MKTRRMTGLHTIDQLVEHGLVKPSARTQLEAVTARYPLALTSYLAARLEQDSSGALARQFLPDQRELEIAPEESADPIADHAFSPLPGLVHRYPDRVLIKLVHVCPVYCRFCFRRDMVGPEGDGTLSRRAFAEIGNYIAKHPAIWEVILTGGDPLMLSARRLSEATRSLAAIPHVKILRWHTRMPVADPARITKTLAKALRAPGKTTYLAVHANHADELTDEARAALARLSEAGIHLVSQSVLLKGVNDNVDTLEALMRRFLEAGVKPYYLHHPDLASGTAHFRLPISTGQKLMRALRRRLSGLAMPDYVIDVPGGAGKVPIGPSYVEGEEGNRRLRSHNGRKLAYPPARSKK